MLAIYICFLGVFDVTTVRRRGNGISQFLVKTLQGYGKLSLCLEQGGGGEGGSPFLDLTRWGGALFILCLGSVKWGIARNM